MQVEFRMKQVLARANLDGHGKFSLIERETGISRRVIKAVYDNTRTSIDLNTMGSICNWLRSHNVKDELPRALIGAKPSSLVAALTSRSNVNFYLGEYRRLHPTPGTNAFVGSMDTEVVSTIIALLKHKAAHRLILVPSHPIDNGSLTPQERHKLIDPSGLIFDSLRADTDAPSAVFVGSPWANYAVERFVADLFGVEPFEVPETPLPFYFHTGSTASHTVPNCLKSCMAGPQHAPGDTRAARPGIAVRSPDGTWRTVSPVPGRLAVGVALLRRDMGHNRTEFALLGFSEGCTATLGKIVQATPDAFFNDQLPRPGNDGIEVGAWLCTAELAPHRVTPSLTSRTIEPIRITPDIPGRPAPSGLAMWIKGGPKKATRAG